MSREVIYPMLSRKISVAVAVVVALIIVTTLLSGAVGIVHYISERDREWENLRSDLTLRAEQLSVGLSLAVWNFDRPQIDKIIESTMKDKTIYGVVIKLADAQGTIHAMARDKQDEIGQIVFGEAENGRQVVEQVCKQKWDLILLDIKMEGRSGLDVMEEIRKSHPALPILVLSMYPEEEFAVRAIKQGAAGYISKRRASEELVAAVKKVLGGGRYITGTVAERLAADLQRESARLPHETLSNREFQVMRMIASGKSLKEIAAELSISAKTVGTYHTRLFQKMGMNSDIELTRYALSNKLVD